MPKGVTAAAMTEPGHVAHETWFRPSESLVNGMDEY
jgi:hypothetical protein